MALADTPSAFRTYALDTPFQARTFYQRLTQERDKCLDLLPGATSWEDFQRRRGVLDGLKLALDLCEELTQEEKR